MPAAGAALGAIGVEPIRGGGRGEVADRHAPLGAARGRERGHDGGGEVEVARLGHDGRAELGGEAMMIMCSDVLRVGLVTKHIPVSEIARNITKERIVRDLDTLRRALIEDFGIVEPRIAVMALNPHAGDGGLLGREEQEIIRPAIVEAFSKGVLAFGPFAADGLFAGGGYAKYDGILAMYHDQGLAPFKSLSPDGVNFTAGLSAVRTSPDHGTAFDIAGKDKADPQSMRNAIYAAIDIAEHRRAWAEWTRNPLQRAERDRGGRDVSVKDLPQTEKED